MESKLVDSEGNANWTHFVGMMASGLSSDDAMTEYTKGCKLLVDMGILREEKGFMVRAYKCLSRNPRKAINCGNQFYFTQNTDAMEYAKALKAIGEFKSYSITNPI